MRVTLNNMGEIAGKIIDKLFSIRLFGAVIGGLVISVLFTLVVGLLLGAYALSTEFPYFSINNHQLASTVFVACFVAFTFLLYFLTYKEREDILTPIRKKLRGHWRIEYQSWKINALGDLEEDWRVEVCTIGIDDGTAKTYIQIDNVQNELFESSPTKIEDITINPKTSPMRITYFHEMKMRFTPAARELLGDEKSEVSAPILGVLGISDGDDAGNIDRLTGDWYDLDGTFAKLVEDFSSKSGRPTKESLPRKGAMRFSRLPPAA
jgi:hypothetical protein